MPTMGAGNNLAPACFDEEARAVRKTVTPLIERLKVDTALPTIIHETASKWSGLLARLAPIFHLGRARRQGPARRDPGAARPVPRHW